MENKLKTYQNPQLKRWSGSFGREYTLRNKDLNFSDLTATTMEKIFREVLANSINVESILEIGCNTGHNFIPLSKIGKFELIGIEPQEEAIKIAKVKSVPATIIKGSGFDIPFINGYFDLVYSAGVLMHVENESLNLILNEIDRVSSKYFLSIDYFDNDEINVKDYHGFDDMLWRRDMRKKVKTNLPSFKLIWEKRMNQDPKTKKFTYAFLFEKINQ